MKKKILASAVLAIVFMMSFSVTAFADQETTYSVAGSAGTSYVTEYDTKVYASGDIYYYHKVSSYSNYLGSRAYSSTNNVYASSIAPKSPYATKVSLYSAYRYDQIRYRGYAYSTTSAWSSSGRYGVIN